MRYTTVVRKLAVRAVFANICLALVAVPAPMAALAQSGNPHRDDRIWGTAIATDGSVALVGDFTGTANFGGKSMRSLGAYDGFVSVSNPDGSHRWSRRVGTPGTDHLWRAEFDLLGSVYVAGVMRGQLTIGAESYGDPLRCSNTDTCQDISTIVKFSPDGNVLWKWQRSGDYDEIRDVLVDHQNHLWVADAWRYRIGEGSFGSRFLRFKPDGTLLAGGAPGSRFSDGLLVYDLSLDSRGDLVASGHFNCIPKLADSGLRVPAASRGATLVPNAGAAAFDRGGHIINSPRNAFVLKFSPEGVLRWSTVIGGESDPSDACCEALGPTVSLPDGTLLAGIDELKRTYDFHSGRKNSKRTAIVISSAGATLGEFRSGSMSGLAATNQWLVTYPTRGDPAGGQLTLTRISEAGSVGSDRFTFSTRGLMRLQVTPNGRFVAVFAMWLPNEPPSNQIGIEGVATLRRASGARHLVLVGSLDDAVALTWKQSF
ncbi:MAG: hypothetical protein ACKOAI_04990 [Acidimicrobiia bacterium]